MKIEVVGWRAEHDHTHGYPTRAFVGTPGIWVQRHGQWCRPLHVWLYRGAWRVVCFVCMTALHAGYGGLYGGGYQSLPAAMNAALAHCRKCPHGGTQ